MGYLKSMLLFQIITRPKGLFLVQKHGKEGYMVKTLFSMVSNEIYALALKIPLIFTGMLGAIIAALGGWSTNISTLLIFMLIDLMTGGVILPIIFHKSKKSKNGKLESKAFAKGLCRKGMYLAVIWIAYRLDLTIGVHYIRDTVIIAFIANELISITENAGLMGIPLPAVITNAIDILTKKSGEREDEA